MSKSKKQALISKVQAMPALVENVNKQALATSLKVAEVFDIEHRNLLASIRDRVAEISADPPVDGYNPIFIETTYIHEQNKQEYPMYLLNRDAFTDTVMNLNTAKARAFKRQFIAAFNKMETEIAEAKAKRAAELATIKANKANPIWLPARVNSIFDFHILSDVIKNELIPLAKLQKSSSPDKLYQVYAKMIKAAARVKDIKDRDLLSFEQLNLISYLEITAAARISELVKSGMYYKDIYQEVKKLIEKIANSKINNQPPQLSFF